MSSSHSALCGKLFLTVCCIGLTAAVYLPAQELSQQGSASPISMQGSIGATLTGNTISGIDRRKAPFSWMVNGSATARIYGISAPFSFAFSERERNFQQPFNEFGISPRYEWVTLHAGYRSLSWSRYTNAGVRFLGAGVEIKPENLYLSAVYGRLQRAVEEDSTNRYAVAAYRRMGGGAKFEIGDETKRAGISFFYGKDDTASLARAPAGILPMENAALGVNALVHFAEIATVDLEIGGAFLTRNLRSPSLSAGGISSNKMFARVEKLKGLMDVRTSSSLSFAGRAGVNLKLPFMGLRLGYELVEPDYTSFGAYYFTTDFRNITIAPSFQLFSGKMRVSGSLGLQSDNVSRTKAATTSRVITSGRIGWTPGPAWGVDAQFSNYSTGQSASRAPLNDSIRVRNVNTSLSLTPRLMLDAPTLRHVFVLTGSYMKYDDLNAFTGRFSGATTLLSSLSYTLAMKNNPLSGNASMTYSNTETSTGGTRVAGINLTASTQLFDNVLRLSVSIGYSNVKTASTGASGVITENIGLTYAATKTDRFGLRISGSQNGAGSTLNPEFQEFTASADYSHTFDWNPFKAGAADAAPAP